MFVATEIARLDALHRLNLLDTPSSESFDRITRMASQLFKLPIAAVSLTDTDRQWFKSRVGVEHMSIPRRQAPCAQVAEQCEVLVIEDLLADPCYRDSPLAQGGIRFYAGAPLNTTEGLGLGAMCVLGTEPRKATAAEVTILSDLASMVMAQIELQHAFGRIDPVSGLPNRTQFLDDIEDLASDAKEGEPRLAVFIDLIGTGQLDHVTRVMGPSVIEVMVKEAARKLRVALGPNRTAYQVGTTQFAFLAPQRTEEAGYIATLTGRADELLLLGGTQRIGTVAVGVAPFVLGAIEPADVLRIAQGAAHDARASGKLVSVYSTQRDQHFQRSFKLLQDFEGAIAAPRDLRLVYQPRVDLESGRCVGVEALLRWTHPVLGAISPGEFIPLIEKTALAAPTTAWVIETAVAQMARWRRAGIDVGVSVNISAANLGEDGLAASIRNLLERHDVPAEAFELEITETAVMDDASQALARLEELASSGVRLAIDDFGTGYSSLAYLQKLPVHVVKIDRSFMPDLCVDPRQLSLVTMMVAMAKHLGHRVVAEGVENAEVIDRLRGMHCDEVQGFFFARPMPAAEFEDWLALRPATPDQRPAAV